MSRALFNFCDVPDTLPAGAVVIKDVGHDKGHPSITNDAENVVDSVLRVLNSLGDPPNTRIFYYDSDGRLDELCHADGRFTKFKPGPKQ